MNRHRYDDVIDVTVTTPTTSITTRKASHHSHVCISYRLTSNCIMTLHCLLIISILLCLLAGRASGICDAEALELQDCLERNQFDNVTATTCVECIGDSLSTTSNDCNSYEEEVCSNIAMCECLMTDESTAIVLLSCSARNQAYVDCVRQTVNPQTADCNVDCSGVAGLGGGKWLYIIIMCITLIAIYDQV